MDQGLILKRPIISEKSLGATALGEYTFEVDKKANKRKIAVAVKKIFGVDVEKVKTLVVKGRSRRSLRTKKTVRLGDWKKAMVRLKKGQTIDIFETGGQSSHEVSVGKEKK